MLIILVYAIIIIIENFIEIFNLTYHNIGGVPMITKDMSITDIVDTYPETVQVFMNYGMHCFG